jgi:methionyl-tRNA formyltransferase
MKIVFMGTPDFAVPTLEYLINNGYDVCCVVTQPDKPKGRGNKVSFSAVKEKAIEYKIPVLQPVKLRNDIECIDKLKSYQPDVIVVVAFGQILTVDVLSIPSIGCINVHASLLPKLRGAAPINWAIINGYNETGITTMFMDKGVDTGDMLLSNAVKILENETAGELHDRLMVIGAELLIDTLSALKSNTIKRIPQDNSESTYAPMLNRDTGRIDWSQNSIDINNLVRGTNPFPVAFSYFNRSRIKIWRTLIDEEAKASAKPGAVWRVDKKGIHVYTADGGIIISEVQPENGKRIDAHSYTLGHPVKIGDSFE